MLLVPATAYHYAPQANWVVRYILVVIITHLAVVLNTLAVLTLAVRASSHFHLLFQANKLADSHFQELHSKTMARLHNIALHSSCCNLNTSTVLNLAVKASSHFHLLFASQ
jgi:hypothetical protein